MQVLVFMASAAALLLFQLVFGSVRRRSRSAFLHGALWLAHTLLPPLTAYALGLMQASPAKAALYPVWALSLFLLAGGASSITAYDLGDSSRWLRRLFVYLQCYIFFSMLCRLLISSGGAVTVPFALLATTVVSSHWLGVRASWAAGHPRPSKLVADYMKQHGGATCSASQDGSDHGGCRYLGSSSRGKGKKLLLRLQHCDREDATFASLGVSSSRIRGACLSYSLSHLLKRRFFGLDCAEAGLAETRRFVLDGLLSEDNTDEHTEAFRVIEVELGFLHDFFYTKWACIFEVEATFFFTAVLKIILTFVLGAVVILKSDHVLKHIPITTRTVDAVATVLVLGAFVAVETSHTVLRPMFSYWHNSIGQNSVIESSRFLRRSKAFSFETELEPMLVFSVTAEHLRRAWGNLTTSKGLHFVKLPDTLKPQIVALLKSNSDGHPLSNGKASLQRNVVSRQLSWTLQNETQAENMLIWHIATEYLVIALPDEAEESRQGLRFQHREVATKLSRYCAYLMSQAPELLPGNSVDTKFIFDHAMYEARETLGPKLRRRDELQRVLASSRDAAGTIFTRGLKLGAKLESIREGSLRWKLMAEFWVETILYVAPSDNAKAHMERLARGGEFLTHIWALLAHAGILTRDLEPIPE
ncbi:hypothetical protein C2845_PM05G35040 [Panicum miliaceum]|uniref:DUF4220 domain-containing protein n=1 Tax=Panicum miliaceum TaxID=4540 RepID=A0A3L6T1V4_PANMI|nr:hypothetical protein C2845_PM05G35040 [Panicum miliaceum]